jgi:hypothetical protein
MLQDMRRLHPRGAGNRGLCVDAEGAMLGSEWCSCVALAVSLFNPVSGKDVVFDDCRLIDGTMIDAKGNRYAYLFRYAAPAESIEAEFLDQGNRQLQAAGARQIEWYFAEREAADFARVLFEKEGLPITVIYEPWPKSIR